MRRLTGLLLVLAACGNQTDVQELASTPVELSVWPGFPDADVVVVHLNRPDDIVDGVAQPDNCLRISDDTTITANGIGGALDDVGGYYLDDNGCTAARLSVGLGLPLPATIDVTIDDGHQLQVRLARSGTSYQITSCGALECSVSN